jgi:glycosyltransferase involved in cell wall biosynthesis
LWWTLRNLPCDVTLTADFPYVNLTLRMARHRPRHVFVTQNGDWGPQGIGTEAKLFRCDGLVCTNPVYYARNADRWRCRLIPNGVDTTTFRPGDARRDDFDLPAGLPLVLIVSAPSGTKRVDEAIRAVSRLDGFGLVVAGDGPDNALVDALGAELMPGRYFRRVLPHEQMPDLYRCADVCLHMSLFESFGNVYIEALASGLPVVGHRNEVTEWILGDHGYLVDTTDLEAVAAAVRAGFESGADDARRARAVERFAWARVAEDYRSFLAEVVES